MTDSTLPAFDITDPLPSGTTLLEASAGTGKTWTIGALVARYVAEGVVTLPELLVITFGRAASREMRERVRDQLVAAEAALADAGSHRGGADPLLRLLTDVSDAEVDVRRQRLRAALADFDGATIATTHQFCQTVLRSLGTAGDSDGSAELTDDLTALVDQLVDDLYVAKYAREDDPAMSHDQARQLARAVVADPHATLVPDDADPDSAAGVRVRFAQVVRRRLDQRKRQLGLLDHDDLLKRLESVLEEPDSPARALMRHRWKVVLVDEFQDTDPVQWNILDRAFRGVATLVLIGDPKQAIYAFRGGDVFTYLRAASTATERRTLPINWRSDAPLVDALGATFAGARLGHPDIAVRPVRAHHAGSRLRDLPHPAPFRLRVLARQTDGDEGPPRDLAVGPTRQRIADDLAADVAELIASPATYDPGTGGPRPVAAGDIAVLVATGSEADLVRRTFARHGIPAVLGGGSNVLTSDAAGDWLTVLEAMESPQRAGLVRAAALTDLLGHDVVALVDGGDDLTDRIATRVRDLADLLSTRGVAAVVETISDEAFAARILSRADGYRAMTDLRHVAHLLHEVALREHLGLSGLVQWLRRRRTEGGESAELTRRLDSDAKAVQVLTIHASKGLEFPIVHLPFLFNRWKPDREERPRFHDASGARRLDVGGSGHPDFGEHTRLAQAEDAGEVLRLAYVAMTRAKSQLVAWWAPTRDARNSGLHRLLFRGDPTSPDVPERAAVPDDPTAQSVLSQWQEAGGPLIEPVTDRAVPRPTASEDSGSLAVRRFDRTLDTAWRRTSYTGLTREDDAPHVGTETPDDGTTDEIDLVVAASGPADTRASPMADLPKGATFGSLVHGVLEEVDLTADDLATELRERIEEQLGLWPVELDVPTAVSAFEAILSTPLGPLADDLDLGALLATSQWKELDFEIPLGGGDRPVAALARLADVADLLDLHLPAGDPLRPFAARLRSPGLGEQSLRGYLIGSIDLALRLPSGRFLVVDHKTNWLGPLDVPLTVARYRPDALAEAMNAGTYPLQALLYAVVLHRFLRWRLRGYCPEQHLGGVLYLYVRGMTGPDAPRVDDVPYGVFSWRPPAALVTAMSDLLDGSTGGTC